ncbi:hypothetical protein [Nocardioides limicola]|uniref:hypothetical protein n=1 Tax=Nocardioides limicola TaxID=2803368 RepID=UPI00193B07DE|nr:hypothetical protein [Nocardioides sp. DJM-14]
MSQELEARIDQLEDRVRRTRRRSTTLVAVLVAALIGLNVAPVAANHLKVKTSDLTKGAVTTPKIKNQAVTTKKLKKNAVKTSRIANGAVTTAKLTREEKYRRVGTSGNPAFGNGGQGDCIWQTGANIIAGVGHPSFRVDRFGYVHLSGVAGATDGGGGDGVCDPGDPGEAADGIAFTLPTGYRPATPQIYPVGDATVIVVGTSSFTVPGLGTLPAGTVYSSNPQFGLPLDGITFERAGSPVLSRQPASVGSTGGPEFTGRILGLN